MKVNLSDIFLLSIFYLAPFIDAFSGYLVLNGIILEGSAGSPSQVFRLLVAVLMLFFLINNNALSYPIVFFVLYIIIVEIFFFVFHQDILGLVIGFIYGSKIVYLAMVFCTLSVLKNNLISSSMLLLHLRNYIAITASLLILSFLSGFGFNTYAEGTFGFKGFFAGGNSLGIFLGVGLLLSIYYWSLLRRPFPFFVCVTILVSLVVVGSKTALLLSLLGVTSIIFFLRSRLLVAFVLVVLLVVGLTFSNEIIHAFFKVYDVILFRFSNSASISSWVLSYRDIYIADAIGQVSYDGLLLFRLFIGFGAYVSFRDPFQSYGSIDILESDVADLFFMYGGLMVLGYLIVILCALYHGLIRRKYFLVMSFLLLIAHSIMAGHVIFNGMSGVMVPAIFLLLFMPRDDVECRR